MEFFIGRFFAGLIYTLIMSLAVMWLSGIVNEFWAAWPAFGYGESIAVYVLAYFLTSKLDLD